MALHMTPAEHDANPPHTWEVIKVAERLWELRQAGADYPLDTFTTKKAAEQARIDGHAARLYEKEGRWFRGEPVHGWKPYVPQAG